MPRDFHFTSLFLGSQLFYAYFYEKKIISVFRVAFTEIIYEHLHHFYLKQNYCVAHIHIDSVLTVFSPGKSQQDNNYINISIKILETCGYYFCPDSVVTAENPNLERPADEKMYTVVGVYLACMTLASFIIIFGVTSLKRQI
jgi:hypothetical protein